MSDCGVVEQGSRVVGQAFTNSLGEYSIVVDGPAAYGAIVSGQLIPTCPPLHNFYMLQFE